MPPNPTQPAATGPDSQRLLSLVNSMADGVIAVDSQCKIVLYNAASLNILDSNATIQGQLLRDVLKIFDRDGSPIDIDAIIRSIKIPTSNRDYLLHYTDSSKANIYLSIAPVHGGYGQNKDQGYVVVLRDITHEKSLEEERDEFISVVSHELRTPITIAEGSLSNAQYVAERSGDIAQIKQALKSAHDQIIFLSDMFNDLATLSRAERGRLTVEVSSINAHDLVEQLAANYRSQAEVKGLKLVTEVDPRLELLQSSELYVHEILQNFVTNALKYTLEGEVNLGARQKTGGIEFWVSDTGIGISRGDQQKIFSKFFRSEDYRTRHTSGTGLGLYITKKLVDLLKGTLSFESELFKGSKFTVFIPNLPKPEIDTTSTQRFPNDPA